MTNPIRLKNMALSYDEWLTILHNTVNDGSVVADTLYRDKDTIKGDLLHSKKTAERILSHRAIDLTCMLLRQGVKIVFIDGKVSESIIEQVSPPLYDKYYRVKVENGVTGEVNS